MQTSDRAPLAAEPLAYGRDGAHRRRRWIAWILLAALAAAGAHYAQRVVAERRLNAQREKAIVVRALVRQAKQLAYAGSCQEALTVIDTILQFDPQNDYAVGTRPFFKDYAELKRKNNARTAWPETVEKITATASRFDDVPLSDVLEWAGDAYQVEVLVDWTAAQQFGVLPSTPVRYRTETAMPLSEWLSGLFLEASGGRMEVHRVSMRARRAVVSIDGEGLRPAATRPAR